jgi:hypothetical protein
MPVYRSGEVPITNQRFLGSIRHIIFFLKPLQSFHIICSGDASPSRRCRRIGVESVRTRGYNFDGATKSYSDQLDPHCPTPGKVERKHFPHLSLPSIPLLRLALQILKLFQTSILPCHNKPRIPGQVFVRPCICLLEDP